MKRSVLLIFTFLTLLLAGGCTQNDGHIGPLYGSWTLTQMLCNGEQQQLPQGTSTMASFQNNIVFFHLYEDSDGTYTRKIGTWEQKNDDIYFNFTHSGNGTPAGTGIYSAPEWLDFPQNCVFSVALKETGGGKMTWERTADNGDVYIYNFKRTW